jgi:hypothetical protein
MTRPNGGDIVDFPGKAHEISQPERVCLRAQLRERVLTCVGLINRVSHDVAAHVRDSPQARERVEKHPVSFPASERGDKPDTDSVRTERRQAGERVEIDARSPRIEPIEVDGVVDRVHRHAGAECLPRLGGHALRICEHHVAAVRLARQQPGGQASCRWIVVQVPHQLRAWRPHSSAEQMHFQTVAMNDVGIELMKTLP